MKNQANDSMGLMLIQSSLEEIDVLIAGSDRTTEVRSEKATLLSRVSKAQVGKMHVSFKNSKAYGEAAGHSKPDSIKDRSQHEPGTLLHECLSITRIGFRKSMAQLKSLFNLG